MTFSELKRIKKEIANDIYEVATIKKIIIDQWDLSFDIYLDKIEAPVLYIPFIKEGVTMRLAHLSYVNKSTWI
jgi:hypothetical protein